MFDYFVLMAACWGLLVESWRPSIPSADNDVKVILVIIAFWKGLIVLR
jgi:hypothetical protein